MSGADPQAENRRAWESIAAWSSSSRMNDMEAVMWRAERHPSLSSTIAALELLDREPDWDRLRAAHEWGSELVARFRQRVVDPFPHLQPPAFAEDPGFELDYHLRRVQIGPDAGIAAVLELAASLALAPLDRRRPLWEATLITGLEDGRSAYLLKSHHSLSDGIAGVQLFGGFHSRTREPTPSKPVPGPDAGSAEDRAPDADGGRRGAPLDPRALAGRLGGAAAPLARAVAHRAPAAAGAVAHPRSTVSEGARMTGSVRRVLGADVGPPSPLLAPRTGEPWRFEVLDCTLDELKRASKAVGATLNDAYLAGLLGGLHRYHRLHGVELPSLPVAVPVSVRDPDDPMGGNRFTAISLRGPAGIEDPRERIAAIRSAVLTGRAEPALNAAGMMAPVLSRMPSPLSLALRDRVGAGADLAASNFPGLRREAFIAGARVDRMYAFGPLPGAAIMATLVSHNGICCIGLNCDGSVIDDAERLRECIRESLDEVLALAPGAGAAGTR